jgi:hypothetical protein
VPIERCLSKLLQVLNTVPNRPFDFPSYGKKLVLHLNIVAMPFHIVLEKSMTRLWLLNKE